jgi:hypothetical protein
MLITLPYGSCHCGTLPFSTLANNRMRVSGWKGTRLCVTRADFNEHPILLSQLRALDGGRRGLYTAFQLC